MNDCLIPINIFDYIKQFIKQLKLSKIITTKQLKFIENIFFYIEDLKVYKFIIAVKPEMFKRAKRFGLTSLYDVHYVDQIRISEPLAKTSRGRFILIYNPGLNEVTVTEGEDSMPQIKKSF